MPGDFKKPYGVFNPLIPVITREDSSFMTITESNEGSIPKKTYVLFDNTDDFNVNGGNLEFKLIFTNPITNIDLLRLYTTTVNSDYVDIYVSEFVDQPLRYHGRFNVPKDKDTDVDVPIPRISYAKVLKFTFGRNPPGTLFIRELQFYTDTSIKEKVLIEMNDGLYSVSTSSLDLIAQEIPASKEDYDKGINMARLNGNIIMDGQSTPVMKVLQKQTDKFKLHVLRD